MVAKIAVSEAPFAIDKPFSYLVPPEMDLEVGTRVMVPFGRGNRKTEGVVLELTEESGENLKTVESRLDETPLLSHRMLQLASFMRSRYFCSFYDCLRVMLPGALWFRTENTFRLAPEICVEELPCRNADARVILQLLQDLGGEAKETALRKTIGEESAFRTAVSYLLRKKWIVSQTGFLQNLGDKTEKIATLASSVEEAMDYASKRPKSASMQKSVLELMCSIGSVSVKELCYYTGANPATVKRLASLGYLELSDKPVLRCKEIRPAVLDGPLVLNEEQRTALEGLIAQASSAEPGTALLYGVTGSGKTAVYLKLIEHCLCQGKSALLLVPEIALTPQLLSLLVAYFGDAVAVQHSSLSAGERYDQWKRIRSGDAKVVVGTRSAVFAPCQNLGVIILDEEQERSYQSENAPRYDAREIALWRGYKEKSLVLLGSATPSIATMYHAKNGDYGLYTLQNRFNGRPLPKVEIVDMLEELKAGNDLSLSRYLVNAIGDTFGEGKQTDLFLNRRGNSRSLVCVDCGEAPQCPRCSAKLTYHSANQRMMCHYCGFSQTVTFRCPICGGPLKPVGVGTQKAQQELLSLFPHMEIDRMDTDTVNAVNTHERILEHFQNHDVPVLIGTQMVAKGLNLPNVTLVGVLDADLSLYSGSYRSAETTFNMLTQVVGRAGRGETPGQAVIQTMVPNHPVITLASQQDYDGFYDLEIQLRRVQNMPPFGDLASITLTGQEEGQVLRSATKLRDSLLACLQMAEYSAENCEVLGPAPCAVSKINYHYRYRLTLRCVMTRHLRELIAHLLRQFATDGANRGVTGYVDVNGFEE